MLAMKTESGVGFKFPNDCICAKEPLKHAKHADLAGIQGLEHTVEHKLGSGVGIISKYSAITANQRLSVDSDPL